MVRCTDIPIRSLAIDHKHLGSVSIAQSLHSDSSTVVANTLVPSPLIIKFKFIRSQEPKCSKTIAKS